MLTKFHAIVAADFLRAKEWKHRHRHKLHAQYLMQLIRNKYIPQVKVKNTLQKLCRMNHTSLAINKLEVLRLGQRDIDIERGIKLDSNMFLLRSCEIVKIRRNFYYNSFY